MGPSSISELTSDSAQSAYEAQHSSSWIDAQEQVSQRIGATRPTPDHRFRRHGDYGESQIPTHTAAAGGCDSVRAEHKKRGPNVAATARLPKVRFDAAVYLRRSRGRTRGPLSRRARASSIGGGGVRYRRSQTPSQARAGDWRQLPRAGIQR